MYRFNNGCNIDILKKIAVIYVSKCNSVTLYQCKEKKTSLSLKVSIILW